MPKQSPSDLAAYRRAKRASRLPCRHCGRPASRPKQLCWTCSQNPEIRTAYPALTEHGRYGELRHEEDIDVRPTRQPGDPHYRCLWCMAWRCHRPLDTCDDCDRLYDERAVGMPEEPYADREDIFNEATVRCMDGAARAYFG